MGQIWEVHLWGRLLSDRLSEAATIAMPEASTRKRVSVRMPTRPSYRDRARLCAQAGKGAVEPATVATLMPAVAPACPGWITQRGQHPQGHNGHHLQAIVDAGPFVV